jgi:hypothetical protein
MAMSLNSIAPLGMALAIAIPFGWASDVQARSPYDGRWQVTVTTLSGDCPRSYPLPLQIHNGRVSYGGIGEGVNAAGRVSPKGYVNVAMIRSDGAGARGAGRLSRSYGSGSWRGGSQYTSCAGSWVAERRG